MSRFAAISPKMINDFAFCLQSVEVLVRDRFLLSEGKHEARHERGWSVTAAVLNEHACAYAKVNTKLRERNGEKNAKKRDEESAENRRKTELFAIDDCSYF